VASLEEKLKAMEEQLATPKGASDMDLLQKYLEVKARLDQAMNNWERTTTELEKFQN
jgi:ATP-binding cassette subfamily F protein 3